MAWRPALALGLTLAVFGLWWGATDRGEGGVGQAVTTGLPTSGPSIAVLPFVDLSPEQDQAWFSDGLAEELLNLLTRVPGLHVTARTSSFSFKGQNPDIATIAEKLNVNHILEGSVRKWGNRVRITAQLVEVAGSSHLWSETYDRELDDLFAIQDEIAGSVVQSLQLTLAGMEPPRLGGTGNPKAYEDYLHARFLFNRRSPGDLPRAQHYYRQAVEADPDFGRAWAGLAGALQVDILEGGLPAEEGLPDAEAAVERALALAPELPETQFRAGMYYHKVGQADRGKEHFEKALAGRTDDPHELVVAAGDAYAEGQYEKAIELQRRAIALDPLAASYHYNLAVYLSFAGRYQEADAEFLRTQELRGDASGRLESELPFFMIDQGRYAQALAIIEAWPEGEDRDFGMVLAYRGLERHDAADAAFDRLMARPGDRAALHVAKVFAQNGEVDESFRWLETARSRSDPAARPEMSRLWLAETRQSSWLDPLRADPRWTTWGRD
jgi:TolB-like protein/Tfp pilus assembly protein PilF